MTLEFPPPPGLAANAVWTGRCFEVGGNTERILAYDQPPAGWSEDLTSVYLDDNGGEDHYINVASRNNTIASLKSWLRTDAPRVIDIGCASGYLLRLIRENFPRATVIGADSFPEALKNTAARLADVPLLQFDLAKCPLPEQFLDAVIALNVLEHIEDDEAAIAHIFRILRPGGIACLEVPAGPGLYDIYDRELQHYRRYKLADLTAKLKRQGFGILHRSHLGFLIFPAFWFVKKKNRRYGKLSPEEQRAIVLKTIRSSGNLPLMHRLMAAEGWLRRRVHFPVGIRCLIVCARP